MPSSDDALTLLRIAADITRAGVDPDLWPDVVERISSALECPVVFNADYFLAGDKRTAVSWIAAKAAACATAGHDRCRQLSEDERHKREKCLALAEHIELALGLGDRIAEDGRRHVAVFSALPRPLFIVDRKAHLLYANEAGTREILGSPWLKREAGFLRLVRQEPGIDLAKFISRLDGGSGGGGSCLRLPQVGDHAAELWFRQLAGGMDWEGQFLVSLVIKGGNSAGAISTGDLTPRQAELSHHLLAGLSLSEAARRMGISRRTAKDHLNGLFAYSGTRSQVELVAWFTRQRMS